MIPHVHPLQVCAFELPVVAGDQQETYASLPRFASPHRASTPHRIPAELQLILGWKLRN